MKSKCVFTAFLFLYAGSLIANTGQWTGVTDNMWLTGTDWLGTTPANTAPSLPGDVANLTFATPMNTSITLNGSITLQSLTFDLAAGYVLNLPGPLTLTGASGASLSVTTANGSGAYTINVPFHVGAPLNITQNSALNLTINGQITGASTITMGGTGTLVLGANNDPSYTGQITINSGTISIVDDENLGAPGVALTIGNGTLLSTANTNLTRPVSLTGNGGIQALAGITSTVNTVISGSGSLNIGNTGTVVLGGANTYSGGTTVTAGTLSISSDGNLGNTAGTLNIGNGTLLTTASINSARSGSISGTATINTGGNSPIFSGNFGGSGSLTVTGGGGLTFVGSNSYIGSTSVAAATTLSGTTNGLQGTINLAAPSSFLTFSQNFNGTYGGVIVGNGTVTKSGSGVVTFTGINTLNGPTNITQGTLNVNGSLASSPVYIGLGTTLSGSGTVGQTTSDGTVEPGNGSTVGTLSINEMLILNGDSSVLLNLAPITSNNIVVNGTASINGSLTITPTPGFYGFFANYTVLTSTGISGPGFFPVKSTNPAFVPVVSYTATQVLLNVAISAPFAVFPFSNFNTAAVGNNFDTLYAADQLSPDLFIIINTFIGKNFTVINDALDQMHPAPYSAFTELQAELDGQLLSLFHRLPYLPCACSRPNRMWIEPFGNTLTLKKHGLEIGAQMNSGGLAFGYDGQISESFVVGFGGAWNTSHLDWHNHQGHGDVSGVYGGIYFDSQFGNFYFGGSGLAGLDFYDTSRHIQFLTTNRKAVANYQALDLMAQLSAAYLFGSPQIFFYPYANLDYLYLHTHKIEENKAEGLNLTVEKHTDATFRTEMGLGLQVTDTNQAETLCFSPLVSIGWVNMIPLDRPLLTSTFAGATIPFSVKGWNETWNLFNANFGLSISYRCYTLDLQYNAEMSADHQTLLYNQRGGIRFDWNW